MSKENTKFIGQMLAITLVVGVIGAVLWNMAFSSFSLGIPRAPKSTHTREKINGNAEYQYNCIVDESGWMENARKDKVLLKKFFDRYGVQPYLVIKKMKNSDMPENERTSYTEEWYSKNIKDENSFLLMYLYENDSDVGNFAYAAGENAENVMDDEAADILIGMIQEKLFLKDTPENVIMDAFLDVHYYIDYPVMTAGRYLKVTAIFIVTALATFAAFALLFWRLFRKDLMKRKNIP